MNGQNHQDFEHKNQWKIYLKKPCLSI